MIEFVAAFLTAFCVIIYLLGCVARSFQRKRQRLSDDPNAQRAAEAFIAALGETEKTLYAAFPSELLLDYYFQSQDNLIQAEKKGDQLAFSSALGEMILMQTEIVDRYIILLHKDKKAKQ